MTSPATIPAARSANIAGARSIDIVGKGSQQLGDTAFETIIDAINPLQQIPGVGQAYRAVTKDKTSNGAQLAGHVAIGAAVAGPIGMAVGAGVFVLEKALPGVFNMIGKLFSSGKNSDSPADMPGLAGEKTSAAVAQRRPLIDGLDTRPGSKPRVKESPMALARGNPAAPAMSVEQFDALMQSLGAQPIVPPSEKTQTGARAGSDVTALIQANLEKYQRQQARTSASAR